MYFEAPRKLINCIFAQWAKAHNNNAVIINCVVTDCVGDHVSYQTTYRPI